LLSSSPENFYSPPAAGLTNSPRRNNTTFMDDYSPNSASPYAGMNYF